MNDEDEKEELFLLHTENQQTIILTQQLLTRKKAKIWQIQQTKIRTGTFSSLTHSD